MARAPFGWSTFVLAEYVLALLLLRALATVLPSDLPVAVGVLILAVVIGGMFALNMWIRRRLGGSDERRSG
jgi:predicted Na+-dependent transporter